MLPVAIFLKAKLVFLFILSLISFIVLCALVLLLYRDQKALLQNIFKCSAALRPY